MAPVRLPEGGPISREWVPPKGELPVGGVGRVHLWEEGLGPRAASLLVEAQPFGLPGSKFLCACDPTFATNTF